MIDEKESIQKQMPEAVASASYTLISPQGFPLMFTLRQPTGEKLLMAIGELEKIFLSKGYQPDIKKPFGVAKKVPETVPGKVCPKCGCSLVYFEVKGKKHIKCSTQKYFNGSVQGCPYTEWRND